MPEVSISHEFPSCVHVRVDGAKSERSAVQLSRNFASRHYGATVGHWVSGGGGTTDGQIYYTYVYSNPGYSEPEVPEPAPVKLASTRYAVRASREYPAKPNARQRRAQRRSGGYFARQYA